ncbi:MAG: ShlB/FhaC/HecB family hemolysin secretion/activation protein [Verrucomicrobiota bacterium]
MVNSALRHLYSGILTLCFASLIYAQDEGRIQPREIDATSDLPVIPQQEIPLDLDDTILVDALKALVFLNDEQSLSTHSMDAEGIVTREVSILDTESFRNKIQSYLGKPVSLSLLYEIAKETILYYRENNRPVVDVFAPEQDISNGVIQMVAIESKVGEINVQGNKWFSSNRIRELFSLKGSDGILISKIDQDLQRINQNPFRNVEVIFAPGTEDYTTDIILQTEDRFPVRFYSGWEDTGSDLTGDERWLFGFNWGDAFLQDHQMSYQFTGSSDFEMLAAHSGSYLIPLPWSHNLFFYGSYAESNADVTGSSIVGSSWQIGTRYTIPLPDFHNYSHELVLGYEFKQSDNLTDVVGLFQIGSLNDVSQFIFEYGGSLGDRIGATSLTITGVLSPGKMTSLNDDRAFQTSRNTIDSNADYAYVKISAERLFNLPWNFTTFHNFTLQVSNANLLPSEQLGVGGYYSVRGYDERELIDTDEGWLMRHELRTPSFSLFDLIGTQRESRDELQFLAFWDYADVSPFEPIAGGSPSESISSVGAGFRYTIGQYLSLRFDYGLQLIDVPGTTSRYNDRWHIGVLLSY